MAFIFSARSAPLFAIGPNPLIRLFMLSPYAL